MNTIEFSYKAFTLQLSCLYRPRVISIGIDLGNNCRINKKMRNFFIELSILFWTLGIELKW